MACGRIAAALEKMNDLNPDYASVALLASTSLRAVARQRACFRPGSQRSTAQGVHGEDRQCGWSEDQLQDRRAWTGSRLAARTSHMWIPLMPLLAASHTVIAPDLRGAGGSGRQGRVRQKDLGEGHSNSRAPARP